MPFGLNSSELVEIIRAGGESGLKSFVCGDIQLNFKDFHELVAISPQDNKIGIESDKFEVDNGTDDNDYDEVDEPEDDDILLISDPLAYEQNLIRDED